MAGAAEEVSPSAVENIAARRGSLMIAGAVHSAEDEAFRRACLLASNAWVARQWLFELVCAVEAALGDDKEQRTIASGCFSGAFAALKLAGEGHMQAAARLLVAELQKVFDRAIELTEG